MGADTSVRDSYGRTVLHYSVLSGRPEVVEFLLSVPATDPNALDEFGDGALHYVARGVKGIPQEVNLQIMGLLLKKDRPDGKVVQVNLRDKEFGATPLHWAARKGKTAEVSLLLSSGANVRLD